MFFLFVRFVSVLFLGWLLFCVVFCVCFVRLGFFLWFSGVFVGVFFLVFFFLGGEGIINIFHILFLSYILENK